MSKKNILIALTNGLWFIDQMAAIQLGETVSAALSRQDTWEDKAAEPEFMIVSQGESYFSRSLDKAPAGSVAIIAIEGPIMKHDNCGDPGTKTYERMIHQAEQNPNILGVVLHTSSPGGTVAGTQSLANTIESSSKPIVTLAEDLMASAAYWLGSSAKHILAATGTTRVGSIGTMLSFADMQPAWEQMGVVFHEIFADASSEKNQAFALARQKKYEMIKEEVLNPLNDEFIAAVKRNRPGVNAAALKGKTFIASEAIKMGLIDGIGSLQDAVNKVHELATAASPSQPSQENTDMSKITLKASHAALLAICGVTLAADQESAEVELTAELVDAINQAHADLAAKVAELTQTAETANREKAEAITRAENAESDLQTLKDSNPGATGSQKEGNDDLGDGAETYLTDLDREVAARRKEMYGE